MWHTFTIRIKFQAYCDVSADNSNEKIIKTHMDEWVSKIEKG